MKASRILGLSVLAIALAGCQSMKGNEQAQPAPAQAAAPAQEQAQGAPVEVHFAAAKAVKGYRPVQLSAKQTIYVNPTASITRNELTSIDIVKDNQSRTFVKLGVNPQGAAALKSAPKGEGFVTVVGGQIASLQGFAQANDFLFLVRDENIGRAIVAAVAGQQAQQPAAQPAK